MTEIPLKRCSRKEKCVHPEQQDGGWLPASESYFHHKSHSAVKLRPCCKACTAKQIHDRWLLNNPEKAREIELQAQGFKICKRGDRCVHPDGPILPANEAYFFKSRGALGLHSYCIACNKARDANRYHADPKNILRRNHSWRLGNIESARDHDRARDKTPERKLSRTVHSSIREARRRDLPCGFTRIDWQRALDYFNGCCAVCQRQLNSLLGTHCAAADHWIPLASWHCPGTVPTNIVPLCHGENGCNNSKGAKDPQVWLTERFDKPHSAEILARIHVYFQWVKTQGGA